MYRPRHRWIPLLLVLALILFGAGWYAHSWHLGHADHRQARRIGVPGFRFTSPLLDVELPEGLSIGHEPIPFKHKVVSLVRQKIDSGKAREIAVYYRDLHDGPWFGINEDAIFNPASMMKVPVMIAWLKRAEKDPQVLRRTFVYSGKENMSALQDILPSHTLEAGKRYAVDKLLRIMMNYSDNNATAVLFNGLEPAELNEVLEGMDVNNSVIDNTNAITVHGYSGFFRILYNASFLSREMSEKALALLSLQDFPKGILAGVPPGTTVSAKFGEYVQGEVKQLHEFGIVYHRAHPYILGIMTRGDDFAEQKDILAAISRMIYEEVDSQPGMNAER